MTWKEKLLNVNIYCPDVIDETIIVYLQMDFQVLLYDAIGNIPIILKLKKDGKFVKELIESYTIVPNNVSIINFFGLWYTNTEYIKPVHTFCIDYNMLDWLKQRWQIEQISINKD